MPTQDADVFHAISHPARRALLLGLMHGERSAGELADPFEMSFAAVSQHLRVLEEAELVVIRRDGRHRMYSLRAQPLREVGSFLRSFQAAFDQRLDALGDHLDRKHGKRK